MTLDDSQVIFVLKPCKPCKTTLHTIHSTLHKLHTLHTHYTPLAKKKELVLNNKTKGKQTTKK